MCIEHRCYFCGSELLPPNNFNKDVFFLNVNCPVCGNYCLDKDFIEKSQKNRDEIAFYLYFFNKLQLNQNSNICIIDESSYIGNIKSEEKKQMDDNGFKFIGINEIKNIYPCDVNKKLNYLLFALVKKNKTLGEKLDISIEELASACSINKDFKQIPINPNSKITVDILDKDKAWEQIDFILKDLVDKKYLKEGYKKTDGQISDIVLTVDGMRHYETIKNKVF